MLCDPQCKSWLCRINFLVKYHIPLTGTSSINMTVNYKCLPVSVIINYIQRIQHLVWYVTLKTKEWKDAAVLCRDQNPGQLTEPQDSFPSNFKQRLLKPQMTGWKLGLYRINLHQEDWRGFCLFVCFSCGPNFHWENIISPSQSPYYFLSYRA